MSLISILTIGAYVIISIFIRVIINYFLVLLMESHRFDRDEMQMQTISQFFLLPWVTVMRFTIIIMQKYLSQFLNNDFAFSCLLHVLITPGADEQCEKSISEDGLDFMDCR